MEASVATGGSRSKDCEKLSLFRGRIRWFSRRWIGGLLMREKNIRFNCGEELLSDVDACRSRNVCRTQLIESALHHYLALLKRNGVQQNGAWTGWLSG